jgi:hypothetical protein
MAAYSKKLFSSSTQGKPIKVVATATPGTNLHTTGTSSTIIDELWLWAYNGDTVDRELTLEIGGTASPDNQLKITVPTKSGWIPIMQGQPYTGSGAATLSVAAFAAAANVITVQGFVNRIT